MSILHTADATTPMNDKPPETTRRTGGQILVDALRVHGADRLYCVPGESYMAALDALRDAHDIQTVVCRHEGAAANMAEADGKLTGRPGICFVTRGPGATHASVGVHTALQDSTPMILFIGQVERANREREAFQEIDYGRMFGGMAKWAAEINDPRRIPELVARAFWTATAGRPGPVVLSLPEDMLQEECSTRDTPPYRAVRASPSAADLGSFNALVERAERPLVILGGGGWTGTAWDDVAAFIEADALPVIASFRCQHLFDNGHSNYVGHLGFGVSPKLATRVKAADLLIVIGPRLGEATTGGYTLIEAPNPQGRLIHVHASAEELGRVYQPTLAINSGMAEFAAAVRATVSITSRPRWHNWLTSCRAEYEEFVRIPVAGAHPFGTSQVMALVEQRLPPNAIVANGAGNFAIWIHRYHQYRRFRTQLAPTSGAMGYGLPAAIAAKLRHPDRPVVCFAGDGDFMMYPQELSTAAKYKLPVIVVVINNGIYGSIRMHQERSYPGRVFATDLVNPDFAAFARSFGLSGETVTSAEAFAAAFDQALASVRASLIEVQVDPGQITPDWRLSVAGV
jgi:acetolactate synthase I/II/III large subunit